MSVLCHLVIYQNHHRLPSKKNIIMLFQEMAKTMCLYTIAVINFMTFRFLCVKWLYKRLLSRCYPLIQTITTSCLSLAADMQLFETSMNTYKLLLYDNTTLSPYT